MSNGDGGGSGRACDEGTKVCDTDGAEAYGGGKHAPSPSSTPSTRLPPARPSTSPPPDSPPPPPPDRPADSSSSDAPPVRGYIRRSRWWYLLPIFLTIVGGVIAYFVLRHDDPQKARNCLVFGIVIFVMHLFVQLTPFAEIG